MESQQHDSGVPLSRPFRRSTSMPTLLTSTPSAPFGLRNRHATQSETQQQQQERKYYEERHPEKRVSFLSLALHLLETVQEVVEVRRHAVLAVLAQNEHRVRVKALAHEELPLAKVRQDLGACSGGDSRGIGGW